jgi:hypothetical protein
LPTNKLEKYGRSNIKTTALSDADREHMCKKLVELIEHCQKCVEDMQYNERLCRTWLEKLRSGTPLKLTEVQDSLNGYDGLRTIGRIGRDWCLWHAPYGTAYLPSWVAKQREERERYKAERAR